MSPKTRVKLFGLVMVRKCINKMSLKVCECAENMRETMLCPFLFIILSMIIIYTLLKTFSAFESLLFGSFVNYFHKF